MNVQKQRLTLAQGQHAHVLVAEAIKMDKVQFDGDAVVNEINFFTLPNGGTVEHEIPLRGNSNARTPHAPVTVPKGRCVSVIQVEFNPLNAKIEQNYD